MTLQDLKKSLEARMAHWDRAMMDFQWENKSAYADWCAQTYYYVCHSTRLLAYAASRLPLDRNDVFYRCIQHIKEETGHEKIALNDLTHLGERLENYPERRETREFYQSQYQLIQNQSPYALFGYILMLEGAAALIGPKCYERATKTFGPKAALFWKVHSEEDQNHLGEAFHFLEKVPQKELVFIETNCMKSGETYLSILEAIQKSAKGRNRAA